MSHFFKPGTFVYHYHKDTNIIDITILLTQEKVELSVHICRDGYTSENYRKVYDVPQKRMADDVFRHFPENVHSLQFLYLDEDDKPICMARLTRRGYWKYYRLKQSILDAEIFAENCAATGSQY